MAMKFVKNQAREVSIEGVQFVAFTSTSGVYPEVLVWERNDEEPGEWAPVAWRSSPDSAEVVSGDDLELEIATRDGGAVLLGEDCTRQQFYSFVFGTDAFADSAFADSAFADSAFADSAFAESNPEELGFESDIWYPAQFEAPDYLMTDNNYLVEYHEGLDLEQAETEVRKDLDALDEHARVEMYGSSYRA